jgi:Zn-dependent peptidase ImmA (M78 family)/DNA-binding XRE family transcriptional regulator
MSVKALVNPQILIWARESANMSLEEAAKAPNVSAERLASWESGEDYPTLNQAKKLAKKYQRAFSLFYLSEIPSDFTPIKDFRSSGGAYSSALIFFIREVETKVNWLRDLMISENQPVNKLVGHNTLADGVDAVAKSIRQALSLDERFSYEKGSYRFTIEQCELNGINVLRAGSYHSHAPVDPNEVRGFTIADSYAPFVFINSRDSDEANLFTLVHELAHIWIKETGVSNLVEIDFRTPVPGSGVERIEVFCNQVAAKALMPDDLIRNSFSGLSWESRAYEQERKRFGVSKLALAYKLLYLELWTAREFNSWKAHYNLSIQNNNQSKPSSGGDYYRNMLVRNGKMFSSLVINLYSVGALSGSTASGLLNIKLNNLKEYQARFT